MVEGEVVVVAEVEGGEGAVEEIAGDGGGEFGSRLCLIDLLCVHLHIGIVADEADGSRGKQ